jgi:hypothetical protein
VPTTLASGETLTVLAELGFLVRKFTLNSSTLDGTDVLDGTLEGEDISAFCYEVSVSRGRQDQLQTFSAGTCRLVLNNNDRRFDPINETSPYWDASEGRSGVTPRRLVTVTVGSETIFTGRITDISLDYATGKSTDISTVEINCADDFVTLANTVTTADRTPTSQLTGARVSAVLAFSEVDYDGDTDIDTGTATLGTQTIAANTNVIQYLQDVATAEQGNFFVARDGTLTFTDRVASAFASVSAAFKDDAAIRYTTLGVSFGQELFYNKVVATREGGTPQTANDATSQATWGITTLALSGLLFSTDAQAATLAADLLDRYKEPLYRFDSLGVFVSGLAAADRATVNGLELGDVVTVERNYLVGSPLTVTEYQSIERISHTITPGAHRAEFRLGTAEIVFQLLLDDATFGTLDGDNALA